MRPNAEAALDIVMGRGPIPTLARARTRRNLVALAYHGVDDRASFARHITHLVRYHHVVSLDDVLGCLHGQTLPANAVLITFDDGERTVLEEGLPELQKWNLPSVLFAVPGLLDTDTPFWWVEVSELVQAGGTSDLMETRASSGADLVRALKLVDNARRLDVLAQLRRSAGIERVRTAQLTSDEVAYLDRSGMRVENHSWSHPILDRCDEPTIRRELGDAADRLADILGRTPRCFAYPNGNVDDRVTAELDRLGVEAGFLFDHRISPVPPLDRLHISRVRVNSTASLARFSAIASGLHPAIHAMRGGA